MIISNDGKIVICTPTKVGSTSLERLILEDYKVGRRIYSDEAVGRTVINSRGYKHGSICNLKVKHRILLVRHPLERFASIYAFLAKSKGNFENDLVLAARNGDYEQFCKSYITSDETVWTKQLSTYVKEFRPTTIYRLEDHGIRRIIENLGVTHHDSSIPIINKTKHRGWEYLSIQVKYSIRAKIKLLHKESISILGY